MRDKWQIIVIVVGIILCLIIATYTYTNPKELLPTYDEGEFNLA